MIMHFGVEETGEHFPAWIALIVSLKLSPLQERRHTLPVSLVNGNECLIQCIKNEGQT